MFYKTYNYKLAKSSYAIETPKTKEKPPLGGKLNLIGKAGA
jgi:hypothetical protein